MSEIKIEDLKDSILVSDLFYNPYTRVDNLYNELNLLPLIYDKIIFAQYESLQRIQGATVNGLIENNILITTKYYHSSKGIILSLGGKRPEYINIGLDEETARFLGSQIDTDRNDIDLLGEILLQVLSDAGSDSPKKAIAEDNLAELADHLLWGFNFDIINSKCLDLPLFANPNHIQIWECKLNRLIKDIETLKYQCKEFSIENKSIEQIKSAKLLNRFINNLLLIYPSNLEIDDIIAFRKDRARNNFKDWLTSYSSKFSKEITPDDIDIINEEIVNDFNELSRSVENSVKNKSSLLNASLTGISTALTGFFDPILQLPVSAVAPFLLDKPTLDLYTKLMMKYSNRNWVLYFIKFDKNKYIYQLDFNL